MVPVGRSTTKTQKNKTREREREKDQKGNSQQPHIYQTITHKAWVIKKKFLINQGYIIEYISLNSLLIFIRESLHLKKNNPHNLQVFISFN